MTTERKTEMGCITGNSRTECNEYLGLRYAVADRFCYAVPIDSYDQPQKATSFGPACEQYRAYFQDLSIPERRFYHREFREGLVFTYSEDCLNLNIYTPKEPEHCPVLVFLHGGGFNSMANSEGYLDGEGYAKRGIILVAVNYRVGIFGYLTHERVEESFGHDGNFGLDDQLTAIKWVKRHIRDFGGDPDNITVMGQSAGAISLQYLCLTSQAAGVFQRAILISGGGAFPKPALPKEYRETRDYWKQVMANSPAPSWDAFCRLPPKEVLQAVERVKKQRKDSLLCTMPVVDHYYLTESVDRMIRTPLPIPYLLGITNNDMFTLVFARMAKTYTRANHAYMYFFDVNAPGDGNQAFHSSDLRYLFGTLDRSFRPYTEADKAVSERMMDYLAAFIRCGDPNGEGRPFWQKGKPAMSFRKDGAAMRKLPWLRILCNTFYGDPT